MVKLLEKIRDCPGGFHSWFSSDLGRIVRKPNNSVNYLDSRTETERTADSTIKQETTSTEPKVVEDIKIEKIKIMAAIINFFKGKKTYIIGLLMVVLGILQENNELVVEGVAFMTLRAGIANLGKK